MTPTIVYLGNVCSVVVEEDFDNCIKALMQQSNEFLSTWRMETSGVFWHREAPMLIRVSAIAAVARHNLDLPHSKIPRQEWEQQQGRPSTLRP